MSAEVLILAATAVLAIVALGAAVISVRAVRALREAPSAPPVSTELAIPEQPIQVTAQVPAVLAPRLVEGRLIVPPTQQQVVATALGRPGVRLSVFAHGVAHALRPESRDRILGMMRREYRRRRRERLQAGRRAARAATPSAPADSWLSS
jgi:hypothetical protein